MVTTTGALQCDLLIDLRNSPVADGQLILLLGVNAYNDGLGGFYRWAEGMTGNDDTTYYNLITSNVSTTGRWVRIFQRVRKIATNTLVSNGAFKTLFCPSSTDGNGRVTVYLTDDGTAGGNALFTNIMQTAGEGTTPVADPNNVLIGARYSLSADLKTLVYQFARGNTTVLAALGLNLIGLRSAATGSPVSVRIDGM